MALFTQDLALKLKELQGFKVEKIVYFQKIIFEKNSA